VQALPRDIGWIEVVCGPMFSGKTSELIRRLERCVYARQRIEIFKPSVDTRYAEEEIVTHSQMSLRAKPVRNALEILERSDSVSEVVGIDEAQFFDGTLIEVVQELAARGKRVIIAGLDQDFRGEPFEPIPSLMAVAEFVSKQLAICMVCGNPAGRSQRMVSSTNQVVLGAGESYEARCRRCHTVEAVERPVQEELFTAASLVPVEMDEVSAGSQFAG